MVLWLPRYLWPRVKLQTLNLQEARPGLRVCAAALSFQNPLFLLYLNLGNPRKHGRHALPNNVFSTIVCQAHLLASVLSFSRCKTSASPSALSFPTHEFVTTP